MAQQFGQTVQNPTGSYTWTAPSTVPGQAPGAPVIPAATLPSTDKGIVPPSVLPAAPAEQPQMPTMSATGMDNNSYLGLLNTINGNLQQNNSLVDQKNAIQKQLFDTPLTAEELKKLSPEVQSAIQSGNQDMMKLQLKIINDSLQGRNDSVAKSIGFLTSGYNENQKNTMAALNQLQTFAQNTGYSIGELARAYAPVIGGGVSEQLLKNLEALGTAPFMKSSMISSSGSGTSTADDQVLQGMLNIYQSTGVIPPMGLSASGLRTKFYAAIGADGANFVAGANANKIMLSGINKAYATQSNQYSATQTSLGTLDKQLSLAKTYSDKVDRSGSPVFNKYQLYLKGSVAGDPDTKAFENIVKTASTEFAKILAGASASVAGVTVSSASDAEHLLNSSLTQAQFDEVIQVMRTEGQYRLDAQKESMSTLVGDAKKLQSTGMDTLPPDEQTKINMQSEMITTFGQGTYDQLKKDNPGVSDDELYKELKAAGKL